MNFDVVDTYNQIPLYYLPNENLLIPNIRR